ncbi:hypothetical protein MRX96_028425 [Rhipicephalus microplus]
MKRAAEAYRHLRSAGITYSVLGRSSTRMRQVKPPPGRYRRLWFAGQMDPVLREISAHSRQVKRVAGAYRSFRSAGYTDVVLIKSSTRSRWVNPIAEAYLRLPTLGQPESYQKRITIYVLGITWTRCSEKAARTRGSTSLTDPLLIESGTRSMRVKPAAEAYQPLCSTGHMDLVLRESGTRSMQVKPVEEAYHRLRSGSHTPPVLTQRAARSRGADTSGYHHGLFNHSPLQTSSRGSCKGRDEGGSVLCQFSERPRGISQTNPSTTNPPPANPCSCNQHSR